MRRVQGCSCFVSCKGLALAPVAWCAGICGESESPSRDVVAVKTGTNAQRADEFGAVQLVCLRKILDGLDDRVKFGDLSSGQATFKIAGG